MGDSVNERRCVAAVYARRWSMSRTRSGNTSATITLTARGVSVATDLDGH